jgi:3-phosphoshikimate 1-carboxyvinyltransferase
VVWPEQFHFTGVMSDFSVMSMPEWIEIVAPESAGAAEITVPGSKSITNRALVLAALGNGETVLVGALWSEDTQVMTDCLRDLGYMINVDPDPLEPCNRTLTIYGQGGDVPPGGSPTQPLELYVANAGTAARFLAAMVCLGRGYYRIHGTSRMHERPQHALFGALRQLGYRIDATQERLPALIEGAGPRSGKCRVTIEDSSQFASALLLGAKVADWQIQVEGENAEESPYVVMTTKLIDAIPAAGGRFQIEPDASSGSYFQAAGAFLSEAGTTPGLVRVAHWPSSGWQVDQQFEPILARLLSASSAREDAELTVSRRDDLGDSIMTAIVMAPLLARPVRFTELGRLRLQECERVKALRMELTRCGARVDEENDTLTVYPSRGTLCGAEIRTYEDHRMAMSFAILGLKLHGIKLQNPACVKKTFPNFFQKLAAPPPHGLGAGIRDASSGRLLAVEELFAG